MTERRQCELEETIGALRSTLLDLWTDLAVVRAEIAAIRRLRMRYLIGLTWFAVLLIIVLGLCFIYT